MGVRSLVKKGLKKALGVDIRRADSPANQGPSPTPPKAPTPVAKPQAPVPKAQAPVPKAPKTQAPKAVAEAPKAAKIDKAKIERARMRARKGVLSLMADKGGKANLSEMHDHSERRYFIAHKAFSNLMEDMVRDEVILWDADEGIATLTDWGRKEIAS